MTALVGLSLALTLLGTAASQSVMVSQAYSPAQIAEARKEGDTLLFAGGAQDLFDNETGLDGTATIRLRHRASGFVCELDPGEGQNSVIVYPNPRRGDDVGCNTMTGHGDRTTNFTRDSRTDDVAIAGASDAIRLRIPGVQPAPEPTDVRSFATLFPDVPTPKSGRFVTARSLEEVISAHVSGWLVEERYTAPVSWAKTNELDRHWYATVADGVAHQRSGAAAAPVRTVTHSKAEEIAIARAEGDRIARANGNAPLFDNITDSNVIALRHKASGLICRFDLGSAAAIIGGGMAASNRADAINCLGSQGPFHDMMTIMPNRDHLTKEQALAAAVEAARAFYKGLVPFRGDGVSMSAKGVPGHVTARFVSEPGPAQEYLYESAAVVGDWIVTEQVIGPSTPPMAVDLVGELNMTAAIDDLSKAKASAP